MQLLSALAFLECKVDGTVLFLQSKAANPCKNQGKWSHFNPKVVFCLRHSTALYFSLLLFSLYFSLLLPTLHPLLHSSLLFTSPYFYLLLFTALYFSLPFTSLYFSYFSLLLFTLFFSCLLFTLHSSLFTSLFSFTRSMFSSSFISNKAGGPTFAGPFFLKMGARSCRKPVEGLSRKFGPKLSRAPKGPK